MIFFKWILKILVIFVFVQLTTYGWKFSRIPPLELSDKHKITIDHLETVINFLSKDIGIRNYIYYENLQKTADYIIHKFQSLGYTTEEVVYDLNGRVFRNIVAYDGEKDPQAEVIILGAHYDSCSNPGADDNASGVAAILELAELLKGRTFERKIVFVAFVNEEPPFYGTQKMGSRYFTKQLKRVGTKVKVAVVFDLIGYFQEKIFSQRYFPFLGVFYPNQGNFIAALGNFETRHIVKSLAADYKQHSPVPMEWLVAPSFTPAVNFSDHRSFWEEGYCALLITDTAFMRNPYYHSHLDLPATLDYKRMAIIIHGLKSAIESLANEDKGL